MPDDDDAPRNPFVRWKKHVDASVSAALNGALGVPTALSKNLELRRRGGRAVAPDDYKLFRYLWQPDPVLEDEEEADRRRFDERMAWQRAHLGYDPAVNELADFLQNSPYSPLNLGHLPQPVPNGSPPHRGGSGAFTFSDAFVDLMYSATTAQNERREDLLPLDGLLALNKKRHLALGHREPTWPGWVLYYRMGLFDSFLRELNPPGWMDGTSADRLLRWQRDEAGDRTTVQNWMAEAAEAYRTERPDDASAPATTSSAGGGLFDELDHAFRVLKRVIEEETGSAAPGSHPSEADTEDQLYKAVKSAFAEPGKSLGTLIKTMTGGNVRCEVNGSSEFRSERRAATSRTTTTGDEQAGSDLRTVTKTEEHVDFLGNRHVKTVTRVLNADGDEVSRQTQYTVRSQPPRRGATGRSGADDGDDDAGDDAPWGEEEEEEDEEDSFPRRREREKPATSTGSRNKGGWFWK